MTPNVLLDIAGYGMLFLGIGGFAFAIAMSFRKSASDLADPDDERRQRVAAIVKRIESLSIPVVVMDRTLALLAEKGVQLSQQQQEFMAQGFRDFLIAVTYNRYIDHAGSPNHAVSMTSDTVDMLWHAWLEQADYEETFRALLGFRLTHLPETPERVAGQRGEGKIDFLKVKPHYRAVQTYHTLVASLALVKRRANTSALYNLDRMTGNPQGFYYNAGILLALGQTAFNSRVRDAQYGGFYPTSNCRDGGLAKRGGSGNGVSPAGSSCGSSCGSHAQSHADDSGAGHGCSSGHGCGSSCGSGCGH